MSVLVRKVLHSADGISCTADRNSKLHKAEFVVRFEADNQANEVRLCKTHAWMLVAKLKRYLGEEKDKA